MDNTEQDYFIIYNPISGNGRGNQIIKIIEKVFTQFNKTYQIIRTEHAKHAIEICKNLNLPVEGKSFE